MELSVQILTRNDEPTIATCIESLLPYNPEIIVGDMDSQDKTVEICQMYPIKVKRYKNLDYAKARNDLSTLSKYQLKLFMNGNETIYSGLSNLVEGDVSILSEHVLSKEFRVFTNRLFNNRVFECLVGKSSNLNDLIIYKHPKNDQIDKMMQLENWKKEEPLNPVVDYYRAMMAYSLNKYDHFMNICDHYFFINKDNTIQSTILRYYYANILFLQDKPKECLQNLVICLANKPTMPELWCLAGDVYWHSYNNNQLAIALYENAMIVGKYRLPNDPYPMEIAKYNDYPDQMIAALTSK